VSWLPPSFGFFADVFVTSDGVSDADCCDADCRLAGADVDGGSPWKAMELELSLAASLVVLELLLALVSEPLLAQELELELLENTVCMSLHNNS